VLFTSKRLIGSAREDGYWITRSLPLMAAIGLVGVAGIAFDIASSSWIEGGEAFLLRSTSAQYRLFGSVSFKAARKVQSTQ